MKLDSKDTKARAGQHAVQMDVDVLVAGGGPAGIGAALGAARHGASVLLVERMAFLGGVGAVGLGMTINQMRPRGEPRSLIHEALVRQVEQFGPAAFRFEDHALITNTEYLKLAAMRALEDAGVDYLLYALVTEALVADGAIVGAIVSTKGGPIRVNARRVVDATGDGDVAYLAGCEAAKGREPDGFLSPMTSLFVYADVDVEPALAFQKATTGEGGSHWVDLMTEARAAGYVVPERIVMTRSVYSNALVVNHSGTRGYGAFDGTSSRDLTRAERLMRQQAIDLLRFLHDRAVPGFERAYLEQVSAWTGVRETRRIVGEYVLTESDAKTAARFPDAIARRFGFLDVGFVRYEEMTPHDVPYRALLPREDVGVENLLASGRNISTTHVAMSAGKSMGNCIATGHAAGVASALSLRLGVTPRDLDVALLQRALVEDGVPLDR